MDYMDKTLQRTKTPQPTPAPHRTASGLALCGAVGLVTVLIGLVVPGLSPLLIAIILGAILRNVVRLPESWEPGIGFAAKHILRWGVVLLGLQISFTTIIDLGPGVLILVVSAVGITFLGTLALGRLLRVDTDLTLLIASGFSICGAAAVAGVQGTLRAAEEKVAAAIALVVLFGTLMIPTTVAVMAALGFDDSQTGVLIGATTQEVAQVVAAAGIAGGGAVLAVAVTVKLARVALLAPVVAGISLVRQRHSDVPAGQKRPPILPLFVVGFIAMMVIATLDFLPAPVLDITGYVQQFLLATAMFALGLGVHFKSLKKLGARPLLLGLGSTVLIMCVGLAALYVGVGA